MKGKEVFDFYASKDLEIKKMVRKRPKDVTENQFVWACMEMYDKIQGGYKVEDINLKREIDEMARLKNAMVFEKQFLKYEIGVDRAKKVFKSHRKLIDGQKKKIQEIKFYFSWITMSLIWVWFWFEMYRTYGQ